LKELMAEEYVNADEGLVEKAKADRAAARNIFTRGALFFRQVVGELKKVTRPTGSELVNYTLVVLGFVVVVMVVIGVLDWAFYQGVLFTFNKTN
jgi:preprotein translocase subunit SecE